MDRNTANGGYDFLPINPSDSTFPFYPIKYAISPNDSFKCAFYGAAFFKAFEESNISLRPSPKPLFRFIYECWTKPAYIITISERGIVIKEGLQVNYLDAGTSVINEKEKGLLSVFESRFPIKRNDTTLSKRRRIYLDSLINLYPELLNKKYYDTLVRKAYPYLKEPFKYRVVEKGITQNEFNELYNLIIKSGYWEMPFEMDCLNRPNDGCGYILEANNGSKYNVVKAGSCGDKPSAFDTIYFKIVAMAGLSNKIITNGGNLDK